MIKSSHTHCAEGLQCEIKCKATIMQNKFDEKVEKVLASCRAINDADSDNKYWIISDCAGRFINKKAREIGAKYVLEIGTSIGYSTMFLAEAVRENTENAAVKGRVYAMESHAMRALMAHNNFEKSGLNDFITLIERCAPDHIPFKDPQTNLPLTSKIDLLFLDCIKKYYLPCLEKALPLLHEGSLIVADNVISHADAMQDFLGFMKKDPRFNSEILDIGTGLLVAEMKNLSKPGPFK